MPARIARQSESYHVPTEEPAPLPPPEKIASALRGVGIPSGTHRRAAFGQDDHAQNAVEHARKLGYPLDPNIPQSPDSGGTDR